jgi:hypothetical protein
MKPKMILQKNRIRRQQAAVIIDHEKARLQCGLGLHDASFWLTLLPAYNASTGYLTVGNRMSL